MHSLAFTYDCRRWIGLGERTGRVREVLQKAFFLAGLLLALCLGAAADAQTVQAEIVNGQLNIRDRDYARNGPLELSGDWQVIWGRLVAPKDFDREFEGNLFRIPGRWNNVDHPLMNGAYGVATFRATLDLPDYEKELSFHQISPHSAWRLYANGIPIGSNGTVSDQPGKHRSHYTSRIFPAYPGKSELVLHISNFSHAFGGPGHPPTIWDSQELFRTLGSLSLYYALVLGILLAIGLFHLIFYLADRDHQEHGPIHLWFSLLCFVMVYRISGVIPYFHIYFSDSAYWADLRFPYASLFAAPAIYLLFFRSAFSGYFPERPIQIIIGLNFLLMAIVLFTPEKLYTHFRDFSIGMNIFVILFSMVFTFRAMLNKQSGAAIILIANTVFLATAINDAVIYTDNGTGFDLTPFGLLVLGIGYSYALLLRLQTTFQTARNTSAALEGLNLDLEKQVRERTRSFKSAAAKAENSARDQARFIAAASHDLRQPLHALAMFNSALRQKIGKDSGARLLAKQDDSIRNMSDLLQDTLDSARIETSQKTPNLQPFELQLVVDKIGSGFEMQAERRGLAFSREIAVGQIVSDSAMLQRILSNLLDNGFKAARTKVSISAKQKGSNWIIEISDDGDGIAKDDIDRIFESYVSLDNHNEENQGGYGLGLYVVKNFTGLLGGSVSVDTSSGEGTTFVLQFAIVPLGYQITGEESCIVSDLKPDRGMAILVIDDEADVLEAMEAMLESWGCVVETAEGAAQALEILGNEFCPDIAIVDFHLFGCDGIDVIAQLRRRIPDLQVVVITGATEPEILDKISASGLPYLSKPIDPSELGKFLHDSQVGK